MRILLLAAGYATRMHPLTLDKAKPLLEVGGLPVITRLLNALLSKTPADEVVVVTNHKFAADFEEWATSYMSSEGSEVDVHVIDDGSTSDEDKLGAIGDMALGMSSNPEDDWLVAAADNLIETDISPQFELFREHGDAILTVRKIEGTIPPSTYGEVHVSEEGIVTGFIEKPEVPSSDLVSIGLYLYPSAAATRIAEYLESGGNPDAPGYFVAWLSEQQTVRAHVLDGLWWDIGSLETLAEARAAYGSRA
jgi:glucose-1-phosphate thymidylyltransferase